MKNASEACEIGELFENFFEELNRTDKNQSGIDQFFKEIFSNYYLEVNENKFLLGELELYYYNEDKTDSDNADLICGPLKSLTVVMKNSCYQNSKTCLSIEVKKLNEKEKLKNVYLYSGRRQIGDKETDEKDREEKWAYVRSDVYRELKKNLRDKFDKTKST